MDEPVALAKHTQQEIFKKVDDLVAEAVAEGDPLVAISGITQLTGLERLVGLGKAKLLWEIKTRWESFKTGEEFSDFILEHTSVSRMTVDRYLLAWDMYANKRIPEKLIPAIMGRSMRDQVEIAKIVDRVDVNKKDWERIAGASNGHEVIEIKRELTGQKPRKSGLVIRLRRNGDLQAIDSEKKTHFAGYLEVDKAKEDPIIARTIERLTRGAGVLIE
jgi:hypothetical protein